GRQTSFAARTTRTYTLGASGSNSRKQRTVNGQILHEEELAFLADPGIVKVALMANLSHYGSDALAEYVIESQHVAVQNSDSSAQQDALILSVIEQLKT
ncbi:hypothetical protein Tco_1550737, partial [Tanacetum coccineum]